MLGHIASHPLLVLGLLIPSLLACVETRAEVGDAGNGDAGDAGTSTGQDAGDTGSDAGDLPPYVTILLDEVIATVPDTGYGIHTSVYDNDLSSSAVPQRLLDAGVRTLRYPGGGYADQFHWVNYSMSPWQKYPSPNRPEPWLDYGYLAQGSDFAGFVRLVDAVGGTAIITANYGSNIASTGGGEPKEAAAWVAYCNGDPDDDREIGEDSTGYDWRSVGFWASLRGEQRLPEEDGFNRLRIAHPEPLDYRYWEIGNEVFGNGYYDGIGYEGDLHVPYTGNYEQDFMTRLAHPELSGGAYGTNLREFAEAMKEVDPNIRIGSVLNTLPIDASWGPDWNEGVLGAACDVTDFVIIHWYPVAMGLVRAPNRDVPRIAAAIDEQLADHCGERADEIEWIVTETGPNVNGADDVLPTDRGLFATDNYLSFFEQGATNVDWLELHDGGFLSRGSSQPGPAYEGIRLANQVAAAGDQLLGTNTNVERLAVHAAKRSDGQLALMFINAEPENSVTFQVEFEGDEVPESGSAERRAWGRTSDGIEQLDPLDFEGPFEIKLLAHSMLVLHLSLD